MLQTKLEAMDVQPAHFIQYVPVKFTHFQDFMVGEWMPDRPERLTFGSGEAGLYYLIGNIEWQEDMSGRFTRSAIYQYDKDGNQKCWLDSVYYDDKPSNRQRITGPSGDGTWGVPESGPLSKLLPPDASGNYVYGEVYVEEGDYITLVGEHAAADWEDRHMSGDLFLLVTKM